MNRAIASYRNPPLLNIINLCLLTKDIINLCRLDQGHLNIKMMVNNYNKPWYKPVKSYNSTEVNKFPLPRKYISQFESTSSPYIGTKEFEVLIKRI